MAAWVRSYSCVQLRGGRRDRVRVDCARSAEIARASGDQTRRDPDPRSVWRWNCVLFVVGERANDWTHIEVKRDRAMRMASGSHRTARGLAERVIGSETCQRGPQCRSRDDGVRTLAWRPGPRFSDPSGVHAEREADIPGPPVGTVTWSWAVRRGNC
jgi:hypothetical protein